jgi:transposase-like protein
MTTGVGSLEELATHEGTTPVSKRVSPTGRLRAAIDELFGSDRDLASILEEVARVSVRLLMQTALEAEVDAFLGRERYQRRDERSQPGSRNGWQPPATVHTTMGAVELQRPKLRGTDQAFCSRLFGAGVTRTNALESLVISGWVRGLSDRDIEATLAAVLGPEAALSKSTVSRICSVREEFAAWRVRDLSGVRLDYLFLDASHFKMHPGAPAEPVLAAWGIDVDGKPVFVGLAPAASESTDAWDDFLADLVGRGLGAPLLPISDGAAGLTGAFGRAFPASLRQRCLIHRARNVLAKVSAHDQAQVKADLLGHLRGWRRRARRPGHLRRPPAGHRVRGHLEGPLPLGGRLYHRRSGLAHRPSAVPCRALASHPPLQPDRADLGGDPPPDQSDRSALPGETSCLGLVWAVLDRASGGWRGLTMTP